MFNIHHSYTQGYNKKREKFDISDLAYIMVLPGYHGNGKLWAVVSENIFIYR